MENQALYSLQPHFVQQSSSQIDNTNIGLYDINAVNVGQTNNNRMLCPPVYDNHVIMNEQCLFPQQFDQVGQPLVGMISYPNPILTDIPAFEIDLKPVLTPPDKPYPVFPPHPSPPTQYLIDDRMYGCVDRSMVSNHSHVVMNSTEEVKQVPSPPTSPQPVSQPPAETSKKLVHKEECKPEKTEPIGKNEKSVSTEKVDEGLPITINPKQKNRILKRRVARAIFEKRYNLPKQRKPYIHESRHVHAMRRPRGPGGRFLNTNDTVNAKRQSFDNFNHFPRDLSDYFHPNTHFLIPIGSNPVSDVNSWGVTTELTNLESSDTCRMNVYFDGTNVSAPTSGAISPFVASPTSATSPIQVQNVYEANHINNEYNLPQSHMLQLSYPPSFATNTIGWNFHN
ncbi:1650_t:CDS:2 [Cetraspora pellucida]|uniref:Transcriptional activator HAP2 n=1 Tax=Cetraspora pellucida TaxID=1433469 RepID=A0A9N8VVD9_9GLOM|nr:1650_t:CDS:2 [Cetraspora pellucida]